MLTPENPESRYYETAEAQQTGLTFGAISIGAFTAQHAGILYGVNPGIVSIVESASHPVLGWIGAGVAEYLAPEREGVHRRELMLAWVAFINFTTEATQSLTVDGNPLVPFYPKNWAETSKDFLFAVAAGTFYLWRRHKHEGQTE
jgi:hypothetical protein